MDKQEFRSFGGLKVTIRKEFLNMEPFDVQVVRKGQEYGLCQVPGAVGHGYNSGHQVVNLCWHLGVRRVVLMGFDMRRVDGKSHWEGHDGHPGQPSSPEEYDMYMLPFFPKLAEDLEKDGSMKVVNGTVGSALTCFEFTTLDAELGRLC